MVRLLIALFAAGVVYGQPAELNCSVPTSSHCNWAAGAGSAGGTAVSPALNTAGGTLVVISPTDYAASSGSDVVTDVVGGTCTSGSTPANTWHHLTNRDGGGSNNVLWYAYLTSSGAGHTFCVSGSYTGVSGAVFTGTGTFDGNENGGIVAPNISVNSGSVTPAVAGSLIVSGWGHQNFYGSVTGVTLLNHIDFAGGTNMGSAIGFVVAGTATDATWTPTGNDNMAATIAVFSPASGTPARRRVQVVQ